MKVLVFTTTYPNSAQPTHGIFVQERIRRLLRFAEIRVVAPWPWFKARVARQEERAGLNVQHPTFWYIPRFFKFLDGIFLFLSSWWCVRKLRRTFDFDLIDAHFAYPDGMAAALLAWWFGRPFVVTLRGTEPTHLARPLHRAAIRFALARAARVIAVSHDLAERATTVGVPPEKIEVIPNGVDTERFQPQERAEARKRLGFSDSDRLLVSVGNLSPRKGFQRVLFVLPVLIREFPNLKFIIVGGPGAEGNNGPVLRLIIDDFSLGDHAILVGPKQPDEVAFYLNAADLFVLATDFEGCPNVVNEALACGVPVVVSKVGEAEHMIPPGCGLLIEDPDDPAGLRDRLHEALRQSWDRAAIRKTVEGRTWDAVAGRVLEQWQRATRSEPDA